jgi:hypothetical protein
VLHNKLLDRPSYAIKPPTEFTENLQVLSWRRYLLITTRFFNFFPFTYCYSGCGRFHFWIAIICLERGPVFRITHWMTTLSHVERTKFIQSPKLFWLNLSDFEFFMTTHWLYIHNHLEWQPFGMVKTPPPTPKKIAFPTLSRLPPPPLFPCYS